MRPEPAPAADGVPRSSRLGGAILLGVVAVLVAGFLVWMFALRDDEETPAASTPPAATATATATPEAVGNDIVLRGANGAKRASCACCPATTTRCASGSPPRRCRRTEQADSYAVWFTRKGAKPRRLGFAQNAVGEDGVLTTAGPQQTDEDEFPQWFATYEKVLVTKETKPNPKKPGPTILEGTLPAGAG